MSQSSAAGQTSQSSQIQSSTLAHESAQLQALQPSGYHSGNPPGLASGEQLTIEQIPHTGKIRANGHDSGQEGEQHKLVQDVTVVSLIPSLKLII